MQDLPYKANGSSDTNEDVSRGLGTRLRQLWGRGQPEAGQYEEE